MSEDARAGPRPFADITRLHQEFTGGASTLEQLEEDPRYIVKFMLEGIACADVSINLDEIRGAAVKDFELLARRGAKTAWVNTFHMKNKHGEDGLWTVSRKIIAHHPRTTEETKRYAEAWEAALGGICDYLERKVGTQGTLLGDIYSANQWVYGTPVESSGPPDLYLVDVDPRFVSNTYAGSVTALLLARTLNVIWEVESKRRNVDMGGLQALSKRIGTMHAKIRKSRES